MNGLGLDLRHAIRLYRATPISSVLALLSLAAAMACVSAFLSLWSDLSLKPHRGFAQSGLLTLAQTDSRSFAAISLRLIEAIDEGATSIDAVAGIAEIPQHVVRDSQLEDVTTELVSRGFSELRPHLALGRRFEPTDHRAGAEAVTILSHRFWQQHLGGRPNVIGETVSIRAPDTMISAASAESESAPTRNYRIVGIYGPAMTGTFRTDTALWIPFEQWSAGADIFQSSPMLRGVVRPARDTGPEIVRAELNARYADAEGRLVMSSGHRLEVSAGVVGSISVHGA